MHYLPLGDDWVEEEVVGSVTTCVVVGDEVVGLSVVVVFG